MIGTSRELKKEPVCQSVGMLCECRGEMREEPV